MKWRKMVRVVAEVIVGVIGGVVYFQMAVARSISPSATTKSTVSLSPVLVLPVDPPPSLRWVGFSSELVMMLLADGETYRLHLSPEEGRVLIALISLSFERFVRLVEACCVVPGGTSIYALISADDHPFDRAIEFILVCRQAQVPMSLVYQQARASLS